MNAIIALILSATGFAVLFAAIWMLHRPLDVHSCPKAGVRFTHRVLEWILTAWAFVLFWQVYCLFSSTQTADTPSDALSVIAQRTSVRRYDQTRNVSDEAVETLLRAAMSAPTALNLQPWEFVAVRDKNTLAALAGANRFGAMIAQASVAIVVCGDTIQGVKGTPNKWWMLDCSAATENMLLAATAQGLGAVWTAVYPHEDRVAAVRRILAIPERYMPLCVVPIGYPADPSAKPKDKWKPERIHKEKF